MGWLKQDWDWDDEDDYRGKSGGDRDFGVLRFWMPAGVTKRVLFLDDTPARFWEHNMFKVTGRSRDKEICLKGTDERGCPICDREVYPSFIGYVSVIDMGDVNMNEDGTCELTGYFSEKSKRTYQFTRKLYGAKRGSEDKPGVLRELKRLRAKRGGSLVGTVWDVHRSGKLSEGVGDKLEYVETVPKEKWVEYLTGLGANESELELEPVDYKQEFTINTYESLDRLVKSRMPGKDDGASSGTPKDDEIPF